MGQRKSSSRKAATKAADAAAAVTEEAAVNKSAEAESGAEEAPKSAKPPRSIEVGSDVFYTPEAADRRSYDPEPEDGGEAAAVPAKVVAVYENGTAALQVAGVNRTYNKVAAFGKKPAPGFFHTK